jgi:hypothetical protein
LVDGAGDIRTHVTHQRALEDSGLVGLKQGVVTERRAYVVGVGDELTAELEDQAQERIVIEVNPDQRPDNTKRRVYGLAGGRVLIK